jgi:N-acyl-L-homoserine lactone synthetase
MPVIIGVAKSAEELDQVFQVRRELSKSDELVDGWLVDRFDAYPTSINFIASKNGQTIGTLRVVLDSKVGVPESDYLITHHKDLPPYSNIMGCSMFFVDRDSSGRVSEGLLLMAVYFASSNYITHIYSLTDESSVSLFKRVGFKKIGDESNGKTPLLLDMRMVNDFFLHFIHKNRMQDFLQYYERWFFEDGETVILTGDKGEEAFIIVQGEADVQLQNGDHIATLKEGEIFGELALLTDEIRSADVFAKGELQVMVLPKKVFQEHLINNPKKVMGLLRLMGERTKSLISQLYSTH